MLTLYTGKTGSGKTYAEVSEIAYVLLKTKRGVVTNHTEIKMPEFQAYLETKGFEGDVNQRIRIIEKDMSKYYFRFRLTYDLPPIPKELADKRTAPEVKDAICEKYFAENVRDNEGGVDYFIGEAHRHFRAEDWTEIGLISTWYWTQHRHLDDNSWFDTQNPEQVVKRLRDAIHEVHHWQNRNQQSFWIFRKPSGLYRRSFYSVQASLSGSAEPYETGVVQIDPKGIGSCYRTRGAIKKGIEGTEAQVQRKFKLPYWSIFVFAGVAGCVMAGLVLVVPKMAEKGMASFLGGISKGTEKLAGAGIQKTREILPSAAAMPASSSPRAAAMPASAQPVSPKVSKDVFMSGYTLKNGVPTVYLTDGRSLHETDIRRLFSTQVETRDGTIHVREPNREKTPSETKEKKALPLVAAGPVESTTAGGDIDPFKAQKSALDARVSPKLVPGDLSFRKK